MLDRIQSNQTESLNQSLALDKINEIEVSNHYKENDVNYIVDESDISLEAYKKYERENDIKRFSEILLETDEQEANELVLKKAFDGTISLDETGIINELTNNNGLLDDIV